MTTASVARWIAIPFAVVSVSTSGILIRLTTAPPLATATVRLVFICNSERAVVSCRHGQGSDSDRLEC